MKDVGSRVLGWVCIQEQDDGHGPPEALMSPTQLTLFPGIVAVSGLSMPSMRLTSMRRRQRPYCGRFTGECRVSPKLALTRGP